MVVRLESDWRNGFRRGYGGSSDCGGGGGQRLVRIMVVMRDMKGNEGHGCSEGQEDSRDNGNNGSGYVTSSIQQF